MLPTARITSRNRLVLPKRIRKRLRVGPGDTLVFLEDERGVRVEKLSKANPFAAFEEWASAADGEAYRDL